MIRTAFTAAASLAALALSPQPLAARNAQDDVAAQPVGEGDPMQAAMNQLGAMFPVEPLTPEQQARLPQATRIITRMIPEGTLGEMMGGMFDRLLGPMLSATDAPAYPVVEKGLGISPALIGLTEEQAAEIAALLDPAYAERHAREVAVMPVVMRDMMTVMEPPMRKAMSELYAVHFSHKELDDIETFFQTESGAAYARKSFTMSSDPRIVAASMEAMPQIMGAFAEVEKKMAAASADLPPKRTFAELTASEKARIAKLTGHSVKEIEQMAAENRSEAEGAID